MKKTIDELLETRYHVIDILPEQVPADSSGNYFAIEKYFLDKRRFAAVKRKHIDIVLKLNCYTAVSLEDEDAVNPPPSAIARAMRERHTCIRVGNALIVSEPDDTCLTLYNAPDRLLALAAQLAAAEGLFLWQPKQDRRECDRI